MADKIDSNNSIHINNRQRLERYIKKYHENNETLLEANGSSKRKYDFELIGLRTDRDTLYTMINNRVDKMFKEGLLDEAERLYKLNLKNYTNIIGYRELNMYFKNEISLEEASDLIKRNTRRYAKRQFTWFNNQMSVNWFLLDFNNFDNTINEVVNYIKKNS
jgi:tRNA dimethylallyltransferase